MTALVLAPGAFLAAERDDRVLIARLRVAQWAWTPPGDTSEVMCGDPSKWPPDSVEHFIHAGDWVVFDGYQRRSFGSYNVQRVNCELIGDESCQNMVALPSDGGRQHYVQ